MTTPTDIIRQAINYEISNIHTCMPATIVSYDYTLQKAVVKPQLNRKYQGNQVLEFPNLINVPVVFPRTANFSIHFPLNAGDKVMILFSERSLEEWLQQGDQVTPNDPRKFDLSDAIAIVGLYDFSETSPAEDNENFIIKFGSAKLKINPDGTYCFHGASEELMNILDELFSILQLAKVASFGSPFVNVLDFQALQIRFNTLKGNC